jgi:membrane-associated HD superfamily phosphohydrolase
LGLTSDKKATPWDYMYLPEYMQEAFQQATIVKEGNVRKLVSQEKLYLPCKLNFTNNKSDDPIVIFSLILLFTILITLYELRKKITLNWFNYVSFIISSVAGLFLLFMWVGTDHIATAQNMNILWLLPAQAIFLFSSVFKKMTQKKIILIAFAYQFIVSFIMFVWPQNAEISFMIISLIFVVRIGGFAIQHQYFKSF